MYAKHFEIWKIFCEIDESIALKHDPSSDVTFLGVHSESIFPFMECFFSQENCLSFGLLVSCLSLLMGGAIKYFLKNYWAMKYLGLWSPGVRIFFEKFVKPSTTPSYILNVRSLNALNVYQINLYQNLNIMHRIKMWNIPEIFHETIKHPNHKYPTTFSNVNYSIQKYSLKSTKCSVSYRWPTLWNTILDKSDKEIESHSYLNRNWSQS